MIFIENVDTVSVISILFVLTIPVDLCVWVDTSLIPY